MRHLLVAFLVMLTPLLGLASSTTAPHWNSTEKDSPVACLQRFLNRMQSLSKYSLRMRKTERTGKKFRTEMIALSSTGPQQLTYKFLDPGSSGIRNNGMTLTYEGSRTLKIEFGAASGFGKIANTAARALYNGNIDLFSSDATKNEIFTVNRAGFHYLAATIRKRLPELKSLSNAYLYLNGEQCTVRYKPHTEALHKVTVVPDGNIARLEEEYGTLAYAILKANPKEFLTLSSLVRSKRKVSLSIPAAFLEFELKLDPVTQLPSYFKLFDEEGLIGSYEFIDTLME